MFMTVEEDPTRLLYTTMNARGPATTDDEPTTGGEQHDAASKQASKARDPLV